MNIITIRNIFHNTGFFSPEVEKRQKLNNCYEKKNLNTFWNPDHVLLDKIQRHNFYRLFGIGINWKIYFYLQKILSPCQDFKLENLSLLTTKGNMLISKLNGVFQYLFQGKPKKLVTRNKIKKFFLTSEYFLYFSLILIWSTI